MVALVGTAFERCAKKKTPKPEQNISMLAHLATAAVPPALRAAGQKLGTTLAEDVHLVAMTREQASALKPGLIAQSQR